MNLLEIWDRKVPKKIADALQRGAYSGAGRQLVVVRRPNGSTATYDLSWEDVGHCPHVEMWLKVDEQAFDALMTVYRALFPPKSMITSLDLPKKFRGRILGRLDEADIDTIHDLRQVLRDEDKIFGIDAGFTRLLRKALAERDRHFERKEVSPPKP